jgi:hypothetical protein
LVSIALRCGSGLVFIPQSWWSAMLLAPQDAELFIKLHRGLMTYVHQQLRLAGDCPSDADEFNELSPAERCDLRDKLLGRLDLLERFVAENPAQFSDEELEIVASWRDLAHGQFVALRQLKKHAVFVSTSEPHVAYGVLALTDTFDELFGGSWPVVLETVLLPFKGQIVYDSMMRAYRVTFGGGARRGFNDLYKQAKERCGLVTSLPMPSEPRPNKARRAGPARKPPAKKGVDDVLSAIVACIDAFCQQHLNEEYAALCRRLAETLARKRPSPLLRGSPHTWASGIVRTIGWANFLDDRTQTPSMRLCDIDAHFGVGNSTGSAKLAEIRKMLGIRRLDPEWTLPSRMDDNPLVWLLEIDGLPLDIRHAPRELQELAFHLGLIPYIPADRHH